MGKLDFEDVQPVLSFLQAKHECDSTPSEALRFFHKLNF